MKVLPRIKLITSRIFSCRTLVRIAIGFGVLIALLVILPFEENWRARRAWENCKRELEAKGEKLDIASFIPALVPHEQNFAMAPLLAPLFDFVRDPKSGEPVPRNSAAVERLKAVDLHRMTSEGSKVSPKLDGWESGKRIDLGEWQQFLCGSARDGSATDSKKAASDVLSALKKYSVELDEFSRAAERPFARFPLNYQKGVLMPMPHMTIFMKFAAFFCLRTAAELEIGDTSSALRDVNTLDRMQAALQSEPLLISHLVRMTIIAYLRQVLWQGISERRWSDDQLQSLETLLLRLNLLSDYARSVRAERAFASDLYEKFRDKRRDFLKETVEAAGLAKFSKANSWALPLLFLPQDAIFYWNEIYYAHWAPANLADSRRASWSHLSATTEASG